MVLYILVAMYSCLCINTPKENASRVYNYISTCIDVFILYVDWRTWRDILEALSFVEVVYPVFTYSRRIKRKKLVFLFSLFFFISFSRIIFCKWYFSISFSRKIHFWIYVKMWILISWLYRDMLGSVLRVCLLLWTCVNGIMHHLYGELLFDHLDTILWPHSLSFVGILNCLDYFTAASLSL